MISRDGVRSTFCKPSSIFSIAAAVLNRASAASQGFNSAGVGTAVTVDILTHIMARGAEFREASTNVSAN